jgi:hypothetical protein
MQKLKAKILNGISEFFYPKICIHCREKSKKNDFFCERCLEDFEMIKREDLEKFEDILMISTFERIGPLNTFFLEIKKMKSLALIRLAASFMVYQYLNLIKYPMPDVLVTVFSKRYKFVKILTKEVSKILKRPILKRNIFLEKKIDQKILLVTDVIKKKEIEEALAYKPIAVLSLFR